MIFSEKLQLIRKSRGYTQEHLAEALCVSRQAVAKWESGQAYPDILNLIRLSEIFLVTVDYLVKDDECQKRPIPAETSISRIVDFLLEAKRKTYAGKGPESVSSRPASHDFTYQMGSFLYYDTYLGGERFSGEEAVWEAEKPIWSMNYSGRVLDERFNGDFLKAALSRVEADAPYRGPEVFLDGDSVYRRTVQGDMTWFQGYEEISACGVQVYECYFHGGIVG